MRRKWMFLAPVIAAIFVFAGGQVVMHLWNWLAPELFGWRTVTFWQAIGLLALCRILFGGFGGRGGCGNRHDFRRRLGERWGNHGGDRRRCGPPESPAGATD